MNTSVAASAPLKTPSRHGPEFPPPSHQLSLYGTSFGSIPSRSVRNRWHSSTVRSFQYTGLPGKLNAWWAIISNFVKCCPVFPTLSMSLNRTHGWEIARGFAGGLASPLITHGWNGYTLACVKNTSCGQGATIGYRRTRVWPFDSMNERKPSRIARGVRRFLNGGFPRKSYSWHGVSPQVEWSPRDQKNFPHEAHWIRRNPWARNSSTSYSPSGIPFANLERDIKVSGRDDAFRRRPARLVWSTPTAPAYGITWNRAIIPASMWSFTWQWYSQIPGLSGSMSATFMLAGKSSMMSVLIPAQRTVWPCQCGVCRSTSVGTRSTPPIPFPVMTIGPMRPAFVSPGSSTWEWYIHITELPSIGPGPARSGTGHTYVCVPPGGIVSSAFRSVRSLYGAPSEFLS